MRFLLWAWIQGNVRTCPVCRRRFDVTRPKGKVYLESWGPAGIELGSVITAGTCCRGIWVDADYVAHESGEEPQVNSKPTEALRPIPYDVWAILRRPAPAARTGGCDR